MIPTDCYALRAPTILPNIHYLTIALIQRDWSDRMEYNTASPIYLQVINELKKRMVKGELKPGEKMPSNRELAVLFKVNQNTAARIYREMESMGLCYTKRGIGTFVSEEDDMISGLKKEMAEELVRNFMQEMEDLGFQKGDIIDRIADYKEEEK